MVTTDSATVQFSESVHGRPAVHGLVSSDPSRARTRRGHGNPKGYVREPTFLKRQRPNTVYRQSERFETFNQPDVCLVIQPLLSSTRKTKWLTQKFFDFCVATEEKKADAIIRAQTHQKSWFKIRHKTLVLDRWSEPVTQPPPLLLRLQKPLHQQPTSYWQNSFNLKIVSTSWKILRTKVL